MSSVKEIVARNYRLPGCQADTVTVRFRLYSNIKDTGIEFMTKFFTRLVFCIVLFFWALFFVF